MKKIAIISLIATTFFLTACGTKTAPAEITPTATTYTLKDIQAHNTTTDCRSIIQGKAYDLSPYFGRHPWGNKTLEVICGKNGTATYNSQHAGSSNAYNELKSFYLWDVQ